MNASKYKLASWFQDSATITDRFFGFTCEVQAVRRDLRQYRRILEDPDELELLEHLMVYALRNQVDLTITKKEFIKRCFLTTEDYKWWPQNSFYPKMVDCFSKMFAAYTQDLSEIKPDDELPFVPQSKF
ncbi:hypothetical protein RF11_10232 [Thelohanellus kitauei]|uniref:Uncharacterized protein n=1 Tax=Thelohanellus kitauei TaxID=669202 RepID=A0A0C2N6Q2_THEKT|nr:hypothetical protein RF11_10232 [Thelohanellus kitauei]